MKQMIPPQRTGAKSDNTYTITTNNEQEAKTLFNKARKNLLAVNSWQQLSGTLSASFDLIDASGKHVQRPPQPGDFFKIGIPAPGNESGHGYDWVKVEAMDESLDDPYQLFSAIKVRPAKAPHGEKEASSHFFTNDATSTFCVEKIGNKVIAAVYGRNEKPNTKPAGLLNKIRNLIIGGLATLGMNKPQWLTLVKGILEKDADAVTFQQ